MACFDAVGARVADGPALESVSCKEFRQKRRTPLIFNISTLYFLLDFALEKILWIIFSLVTRIYLVSVAYLRVWQKDHLSLFQDQLRSAQRQAGCFLLVNGEALRGRWCGECLLPTRPTR